MKRVVDKKTGKISTIIDPPNVSKDYSDDGAIPVEVGPGSIVMFHGNFLHYSSANISEMQRHAYTLHMLEGKEGVKFSKDNWIQRVRPEDCMGRTFNYNVYD